MTRHCLGLSAKFCQKPRSIFWVAQVTAGDHEDTCICDVQHGHCVLQALSRWVSGTSGTTIPDQQWLRCCQSGLRCSEAIGWVNLNVVATVRGSALNRADRIAACTAVGTVVEWLNCSEWLLGCFAVCCCCCCYCVAKRFVSVYFHKPSVSVNFHKQSISVCFHKPSISVYLNKPSVNVYFHKPSVSVYFHKPSISVYLNRPSISVHFHKPSTSVNFHKQSISVYFHKPSISVHFHKPSASVNFHKQSISVYFHKPSISVNIHIPMLYIPIHRLFFFKEPRYFNGPTAPQWARASSLSKLHDHTQTHHCR